MRRSVVIRQETWPTRGVFRIARGSRTEVKPIVVEMYENGTIGRGECVAYPRYESVEQVMSALEAMVPRLEQGLKHEEVGYLLPPGGARNAIDCAFWDLRAKQTGQPAWALAGLLEPQPVITAFTLGTDTPEVMGEGARRNAVRPLLKLKLTGDGDDLARVEKVRAAAPRSRIILDANEAWSRDDYETLVPKLARLKVEMIEQPFHADHDAILAELTRPIPVCADESCHASNSLEMLQGRYDVVNIKLDKTGGLSEALKLRKLALEQGFHIMVGCMLATSLAMAPAFLLARGARYVDLDGPLLLERDREPGLHFEGSRISPPPRELWG